MAQRAEYQNIVKTIADDMTRKSIRLQAGAGRSKQFKIDAINDKLEALEARDVFKQAIMYDGFFGPRPRLRRHRRRQGRAYFLTRPKRAPRP